ncbi:MAG TPA: T9SS type A sorting domain-containing protein [Cyclobacteriaceae bacterium]|nr:T9SS type A sorting domain-containing protein [Cyclobacteriaceae bacterium]
MEASKKSDGRSPQQTKSFYTMRRYWFIILLICVSSVQAQFVKNSGLTVITSSNVNVNGDWDNQNSVITNNGTISLSDNWTSTGGYDPNGTGGFVLFNTTTKQFNHGQQAIGSLVKNGIGITEINDNLTIKNALLLQNGLLSMTGVNNTLVMQANALVSANSSSYVIGKMTRHGTGNLFFPVSRASYYLPITISNVTGVNPVVTIAVEDKPGGYTAGPTISALTDFPYVWRSTVTGADTATYIEIAYPTSLSTPAADVVARSAAGNTYSSMGMQSINIVNGTTTIRSYENGLRGLFTVAIGPLLPLHAPIAAPASGITYAGFTASWEPVVHATGYQIDVSDDNFLTLLPGYSSLVVTGTSIHVNGLNALSNYKYRVRATGTAPTSPNSNTVSVTTATAIPVAAAATGISSTGFTANWNAVNSVDGYQLDVSTDNFATFLPGYNSKTLIEITETISGLNAVTSYQYRVRSFIGNQISANSNTISVLTGQAGIAVPSTPVATSASSITLSSFAANWIAVTGATSYQLDVSEDNFETFITGYNSKSVLGTSDVISDRSANANLSYRVRAVNAGGTSSNSNVISLTTLPLAPLAIAANNISPTGFSANWNSVPDVTGYQLDVSTDNFVTFVPGYNSKSVTGITEALYGLASLTFYQYRIRYVNSAGVSPNSNVISVSTGAAGTIPPSAPVAISASGISLASFVANWIGVQAATSYQLDVSEDNFTTFLAGYNSKSVSGTFEIILGVSGNATLSYRVRAVNAGGISANSNVVHVTTLPIAPLAISPTSVSATGFSANWNPVPGVIGYQLDVSTNNFSTFLTGYNSKNLTGTTESISGLAASTAYQYRVRYVNATGVSGNSNVINLVTAAAGTTPPNTPIATAANGVNVASFVANWIGVTGAASYQLDVSEDNFASFVSGYNSKSITGTFAIVSGLNANSTLSYRVRAISAGGSSANSNVISATTLPTAPVAIAATNISATGFAANWNSVPGVTGYQLDVSTDNFTTFLPGYNSKSLTGTTEALSDLVPSTLYQYRLRYVNAAGVSGNSNVMNVMTGAAGTTPPDAPLATSASGVNVTSFVANWNAITGATSYQLDVSDDNFATFLAGYNSKDVSGVSEFISGLSANTSFSFRVRAINTGGTSTNSNIIDVTTLPIAPLAISATGVSSDGFSANWNSVPNVTEYQLDVSTDDFVTFLAGYNSKSVAVTTDVLTGLSPSTLYKYRVRYVNTNGASGNSNVVSVTTGAAGTSPPPTPVATSASNIGLVSFVANWNAATGATSYQLDVSEDNFVSFLMGYNSLSVDASSSQQAIASLAEGKTYYYRLRAVNEGGVSANSNTVTVTTNSTSKTDQTIDFQSIGDKTLGDPAFALQAVASSGLAVTYSTASPKILLTGDQVTLVEAGLVSITASQTGNTTYNAAMEEMKSFCINPAKPVISVTNENLENYTLTSSAASGNQWFKDGVIIDGAMNSTLVVTSGTYSVEVTVETCKSARADDVIITITGDERFPTSNQLTIIPNPVENVLSITLPGVNTREVAIFDLAGQRVKTVSTDQSIIQMDVSSYLPGVYLVWVNVMGKFYYGRFIKK